VDGAVDVGMALVGLGVRGGIQEPIKALITTRIEKVDINLLINIRSPIKRIYTGISLNYPADE